MNHVNLGNNISKPFLKERNVSKSLLDVNHSDVCKLAAQTPTLGGCQLYVMFLDDHSQYTWIFAMKKKSEVFTYFQKFKNQAKKKEKSKSLVFTVRRRRGILLQGIQFIP
jgi:hypothetical protein